MAADDNGRTEIVAVRFTKRIRELLSQVAQARGLDESSVVRELVHRNLASLNLLSDDEKKALGVLGREKPH
jgi:HPt (histidine-containing phosphotransfer) domain-containing protein